MWLWWFYYFALAAAKASAASPWAWSCNSTTGLCSRVAASEAEPRPLDLMECKMTW